VVLFPERQAERAKSRWTLSDWLQTKKTMAAQDAWLAAHTNKIPLDLSYGVGIGPSSTLQQSLELNLTWLGLQGRYSSPQSFLEATLGDRKTPWTQNAQLNLQARLLGNNPQNTALIIRGIYESDNIKGDDALAGPYIGYGLASELQVYWAQWLGVRGEYLYRFSRENVGNRSLKLAGDSWMSGAFLELGALRFEFGYQTRRLEWSGTQQDESSDLGLYFLTRLFL
jgi:hypothetical protein